MQGTCWIALIKSIPPSHHDSLQICLVSGSEVVMQRVLRLDEYFMVVRGRMSGSTDGGKVVIIPYHQIVNLAFTKRVTEPEAFQIFGKTEFGDAVPTNGSPNADTSAKGTAPSLEDIPRAEDSELIAPKAAESFSDPYALSNGKQSPPSKSILLARLRARLSEREK